MVHGDQGFTWNSADSTVSYAGTAVGTFKDTLVLSAAYVEQNDSIPLEVTVNKPVITAPTTTFVHCASLSEAIAGKAHTPFDVSVTGENTLTYELTGTDKDFFSIDFTNGQITYTFQKADATAADAKTYYADIVLKATGADDKTVHITGTIYAISVEPASWTETLTLSNNSAAAEKAITTMSVAPSGTVSAELKAGSAAEFVWDATNQKITFAATTAGTYEGTLVVSAENADNVEIPLSITVNAPAAPVITVSANSLAFGEVELAEATAGITDKSITVSVTGGVTVTPAISGTDADKFAAEIKDGKLEVTLTASAAGTYSATITLSAPNAESKTVAVSATVKAAPAVTEFVKVTADQTDWSGQYLLVYEASATQAYVFKGVDNTNNYVTATISDGKISATGLEDYIITIAKMEGGYSLKIGDKYMGGSSGSNALKLENNAILNTLSYSSSTMDIESDNTHMRYNAANDQKRFRYFKATSYSNQEKIALYTLPVPATPTSTLTISPKTASVEKGKTVTLTVDRDGNDELVWGSKDETVATVANGVVTGVKAGEVKIWAKANNVSDTCVVTVTKAKPVITVGASSLAWGNVTPEAAGAGIKKETTVSVTEDATLSVEVAGTDATAFTAAINAGKLEVTFKATEVRAYSAKAVVKATDADNVEVTLSATVKEVAPGNPFTLVTDASALSAGSEVLIVSTSEKKAAGKFNTSYLETVSVTIEDQTITLDQNSSVEILTLGGEKDAWTFATSDGELIGSSAAKSLKLDEGTTTWTISIESNGDATITNTNGTSGSFRHNTSAGRFAPYTSNVSASMLLPQIYSRAFVPVAVEGVTLDKKTASVEVGKNITLTPTFTPANATNKKVTWSSDKTNIATVDDKGVVKGIAEGDAKITVTTADGGFTAECTVTVTETSGGTITTCEEAAEAALSVSENNEEYNNGAVYTIPGYVTEIAYAWKNGSMSFWIADTEDGGKVIEAYKCAIEKEEDAVRVGDRVKVTGKLTKFNKTPEFAANCTVEILERGDEPKNLGEKTIAEFLELKNTKDTCILTGIVANIVMDKDDETQYNKYGNFDLIEGTSKLYVYGLLTADGQAQKFIEMGIDAGDTLTIKAVYTEYQGKAQAKNAIFVSVKKGSGVVPPTPGEELNVDFAQAYTFTYEGTTYWAFDAYDYENDYPELYFDFEATDLTHLNGTHEIDYSGLWTSENDSIEFVSGTATITCVSAATDDSYAVYHVDVVLYDEDGNEYSYSFDVEVVAYDGDNSTETEIIYIELEDVPEEQGIENTEIVLDPNAPIYNIQGMQVDRNTRGILIQNGNKFIRVQ